MSVRSFESIHPQLGDRVFVDPTALVVGDVEIGDDLFEVYTGSADLHTVTVALEEAGIKTDETQLSQIPKNEIELGPKESVQIMGIVEALEELDDVDQVYSGLAISDEFCAPDALVDVLDMIGIPSPSPDWDF